MSVCVPERFFFARRFCPPQVVKGAAVRSVNGLCHLRDQRLRVLLFPATKSTRRDARRRVRTIGAVTFCGKLSISDNSVPRTAISTSPVKRAKDQPNTHGTVGVTLRSVSPIIREVNTLQNGRESSPAYRPLVVKAYGVFAFHILPPLVATPLG